MLLRQPVPSGLCYVGDTWPDVMLFGLHKIEKETGTYLYIRFKHKIRSYDR